MGGIGKTRQNEVEIVEVFDAAVGRARGVLRRPPPAGKFHHARRSPAPELAPWIEHFWLISWDLRGHAPYVPETLPHPNFQVIFEKGRSEVAGILTGKFSRTLEGRSHVFGAKFTPGGFRPFLKAPASSLTNRTVPVERIFGPDVIPLEAVLTGPVREEKMIAAANAFFCARIPEPDPTIALASELVKRIFAETEIKTVDDLARRTGISKRTLQRIFNEYVGATPKWVIRRYRLHELVERLKPGHKMDLADVALELGYFDQAHLINDFKSIVGFSPLQYQKAVNKPGRR